MTLKARNAGNGPEAPVPLNAPTGNWMVDGLPPPPQQECFESSCGVWGRLHDGKKGHCHHTPGCRTFWQHWVVLLWQSGSLEFLVARIILYQGCQEHDSYSSRAPRFLASQCFVFCASVVGCGSSMKLPSWINCRHLPALPQQRKDRRKGPSAARKVRKATKVGHRKKSWQYLAVKLGIGDLPSRVVLR